MDQIYSGIARFPATAEHSMTLVLNLLEPER